MEATVDAVRTRLNISIEGGNDAVILPSMPSSSLMKAPLNGSAVAVPPLNASLEDDSSTARLREYFDFYVEQNRKTAESAISDLLAIAYPFPIASARDDADEGDGDAALSSSSVSPVESSPLYLTPGVQKALSGLIMTFPAVLSIEKK